MVEGEAGHPQGLCRAYSRILSTRRHPSFYHIYIDASAGAGLHVEKATGEFVPGSPLDALLVEPPCEPEADRPLAEDRRQREPSAKLKDSYVR